LRDSKLPKSIELIKELNDLWVYLDELKPQKSKKIYYSEHVDELKEIYRGYGKDNQKPEDYIESFKEFITENRNEIVALNVLYNKPTELDRKSLKELKMKLSLNGFNETSLNTAWKKLTNKEIAADVIAYIRTLAMGLPMETPEERIKRAIQKVKDLHPWSKIQLNWIDRFEKQLKAETLLRKEDLDEEPFKDAGGYMKLNKIFSNQLDEVLEIINTNLLGA
jgi:type I restriction enzyme R subunit